jgi:hypothetical protein
MNNQPESTGLKPSTKARWFYRAWWLVVALAPLLAIVLAARAPSDQLDAFLKLGLLQPAVAALLSLTIVLSMRLTWGRFVNERRKGVGSASSAAIAVRLWAICFVLLVGAMLLSALVARLPDNLLMRAGNAQKAVKARVEVKAGEAAPAPPSPARATR